MSQDFETTGPTRRRRFWRVGCLGPVILLLILVGVGTGVRSYYLAEAEERYEAAVAEIEKHDPRWQWDAILADRRPVPDDQNAAPIVLAAFQLLPQDEKNQPWAPRCSPPHHPEEVGPPDPDQNAAPAVLFPEQPPYITDAVAERSSNEVLGPELTRDLRSALDKVQPALNKCRPLARLSTGRYEVDWKDDYISTLLPHIQQARTVVNLLCLDAALAAEDGDIDRALTSAREGFTVARSIGDEPTLISILVRIACGVVSVRSVERALGQGQASPASLAAWDQLLADEASQPLLRNGLRGERAAMSALLGKLYAGQVASSQLSPDLRMPSVLTHGPQDWAFFRPYARHNQAVILEYMTRMIDATELPPGAQRGVFIAIDRDLRNLKASNPLNAALALLLLPATNKIAEAYHRYLAELHSARAAVAAERYRLAHGQWPDRLEQLVPEFLSAVPADPFADGPILLRRLEDGVVVYSVGEDGEDDGGKLVRNGKSPDIGFRLWDPAKRRQPPAQKPVEDGQLPEK